MEDISPGRDLFTQGKIPDLKLMDVFITTVGIIISEILVQTALGGGREIDIKNETTYSFG